MQSLRFQPLAIFGIILLAIFVALAIFAPWIAPFDPAAIHLHARLQSPSAAHWFGTDELGRDILSRVIYGTRISLFVATSVVSIALFFGVIFGSIAGFYGGWLDAFLNVLVMNTFMALPGILIAIALVYLYLYRTRLGTLTRAVMSRRDEAFATGIDVDRVSAAAFGIGLGLAAVAGVFAPFMFGSVTPAFGADATVTSFAIVVLGSLGNPLGTALGGVVYGVCYMLVQTYLSSWADLLPYVLLIFILLLRPSGLLGRRVRVA